LLVAHLLLRRVVLTLRGTVLSLRRAVLSLGRAVVSLLRLLWRSVVSLCRHCVYLISCAKFPFSTGDPNGLFKRLVESLGVSV